MLSLNPHEFSTHPETGVPILVRTTPYTRVSRDRGPPLFLQRGQVYSEGGNKPIPEEEWPAWLPDEIRRLTPAAQEEVGFSDYVQKLNKSLEPPQEALPPKEPAPAKYQGGKK
jgi:hypothetical protein